MNLAVKGILWLGVLVPILSGCAALTWPHRFDQFAKERDGVRAWAIFRIMPTSVNVWFIRAAGLMMTGVGLWVGYMMLTR